MIRHNIIRFKPRIKYSSAPVIVSNNPNLPVVHTPSQSYVQGALAYLGKPEYARYISNLRMKKGDFCFFRTASWPIDHDKDVFLIKDINEIHWLDKGNNLNQKHCTPYLLVNKVGDQLWGSDDLLVKYTFPEGKVERWV